MTEEVGRARLHLASIGAGALFMCGLVTQLGMRHGGIGRAAFDLTICGTAPRRALPVAYSLCPKGAQVNCVDNDGTAKQACLRGCGRSCPHRPTRGETALPG